MAKCVSSILSRNLFQGFTGCEILQEDGARGKKFVILD
jgi:hypothetical protein